MDESWMQQMLARVDAMDVPGFVEHFTDDGEFRFGNWPAAVGREAIAAFTTGFLATLSAIEHRVLGFWRSGDDLFTEGAVTYTRKDGKQVTVPFLTRAAMSSGRMRRYLVFADPSPLLS